MLGLTVGTFVAFAVATYTCRFPEDSLYAAGAMLGWVYASSFEAVKNHWIVLILFLVLIIQKEGNGRKPKASSGRNRT